VSAEIIQFIRGPKHNREPSDFPTIAFRSAAKPDDLAMDQVDTSPCEYLSPIPGTRRLAGSISAYGPA
jgi:hypothetical protein